MNDVLSKNKIVDIDDIEKVEIYTEMAKTEDYQEK
jgi:hypothetical protein